MDTLTFFIIRGAEVVKNSLSSLVDLMALPAMDYGGGGSSGLRAICALLFEGCRATTGLRATRVLVLGVFFAMACTLDAAEPFTMTHPTIASVFATLL